MIETCCKECVSYSNPSFKNKEGKIKYAHICNKLDMQMRTRDLKGKCIMFKSKANEQKNH